MALLLVPGKDEIDTFSDESSDGTPLEPGERFERFDLLCIDVDRALDQTRHVGGGPQR